MPLSARSVALNGGSVVVGLADGILLIFTITFMASALASAFERDYWVLGLLLSLVLVGLVIVFAFTISAAAERRPQSGLNTATFRRAAAYLLVPLLVFAFVSVVAWGVTLVITGSLY